MKTKKEAGRPRLGRGLAALLGEQVNALPAAPAVEGRKSMEAISSLPVDVLEPSPFQPRQQMEPGALDELASSIRVRGILQPILVRPHPQRPGTYQIIAGERRWRASQIAGLHDVPVHIRPLDDGDAMAAALVENLQRADLNAIEEAEGLQRLLDDYALTQDELASAIGKSRPHVANMVRLLQLPPPVRDAVRHQSLSAGHARALLAHADPVAALKVVLAQGLNVRQTEALAKQHERKAATAREKGEKAARNPEIAALERDLAARLGLKVQISFDGKGGSLKIDYRSLEQFDGLLRLLQR